jgi:hypothetical protein
MMGAATARGRRGRLMRDRLMDARSGRAGGARSPFPTSFLTRDGGRERGATGSAQDRVDLGRRQGLSLVRAVRHREGEACPRRDATRAEQHCVPPVRAGNRTSAP